MAYVSKIRRNLISLGRLDSKDYMYSVASEVMKTTRGCLILMISKKCSDGLYCLMGNTVIDGVPLTLTGS